MTLAPSPIEDLHGAFAARGIALRTDDVTRLLYATDASPYRMIPAGVVRPERADDLAAIVELCRERGLPLVARGAGTSLSGQTVGTGLQVDCSLLNEIEWIDPERRLARVRPGAGWWRLNGRANAIGLLFGPDPATRRQCTIGGMIGSNSGGTHSIVSGATVDHVHAIEAVLADGTAVRLTESPDGTVGGAGAPPAVAEALERVRAALGGPLGAPFTGLARRGSGYQLEHLCAERPHLGKLFAGSDGSLGLITAAEITLEPLPAARALAVIGFTDMHAALAAVPELVGTGPSAVELVSGSMLDVARADPYHRAAVADIAGEIGSLLYIEYSGEGVAECEAGFSRMDAALTAAGGIVSRWRSTEPIAQLRMWAIREAGVGALSAVASGPLLPQAFVEDTTVAVDRLPAYIREFEQIFASHGTRAVWYGHASTGLIHVRPFLNLTDRRDLDSLEGLMRDSVDLVRAYGGDLCGEHGNGISRTYWNERLFGPEVYAHLKAVKAAFDPRNLMNPGKVVDGPHPVGHLRYGEGYRRRGYAPTLSFDDQGGYAAAVERCYGAGACRKREVGTLCPPAAATGREEHSTRARANLLRAVVSGAMPVGALSGADAREVMETCVACKACKSECPARVDMARLKAEWMDRERRARGGTPLQWAVANLRTLSAVGSRLGPVARRQPPAWLKRRLGLSTRKPLPTLAKEPLSLPAAEADAVVYPDCFTVYQEPAIGTALRDLARAGGRTVGFPAGVGCCGRTMISEGYLERARATARRSAAALRRTAGPILFCEPSCMSAVVDDWPSLIGDVDDLAARAMLGEEWVADACASLSFEPGGTMLFHSHCHQKALGWTDRTARALARVPGVSVEVLDGGCCGMAGAFGYLAEREDLSAAMAERVLAPAVRAATGSVVATGTSCRHQIAALTDVRARHPLEELRARLRG